GGWNKAGAAVRASKERGARADIFAPAEADRRVRAGGSKRGNVRDTHGDARHIALALRRAREEVGHILIPPTDDREVARAHDVVLTDRRRDRVHCARDRAYRVAEPLAPVVSVHA